MPYCPKDGYLLKPWKTSTEEGGGEWIANCYDCARCGAHWSADESSYELEDGDNCSVCDKELE